MRRVRHAEGGRVVDVTLMDLVQRFDSGEIRLPLMQRDYVWRPKKVAKLLDSLYKGWPIGSFYVWHTSHDRGTKSRFGAQGLSVRSLDNFYGFLLDGQQRLTCLSLAIRPAADDNLPTRAFFDIEREEFFLGTMKRSVQKRIEAADPLLVPLSEVISFGQNNLTLQKNVSHFIDQLSERKSLGRGNAREASYRDRLGRVASMLNVRALCEEFKNEHEEDAIELFARLNKGGTSLSLGDVEAAKLSQEATRHVVGPMRDFVQDQRVRALGLNFVFVVRALVTVHRGRSTFSRLPKNWAVGSGDIEKSWRAAEKGLTRAVHFVQDEMGWTTSRWLPSLNALIPLAYLLKDEAGPLHAADKRSLKRYLLISGLRGMFQGSVETAINSFVHPLLEATGRTRNRCALLVGRIPKNRLYKIRPEDVRSAVRMYSPLMQVYLSYLVSRGAQSWPSGRDIKQVALGDAAGDPLAVHHIFPKKYMAQFDVPAEVLNTAANYAILAQADNAELGDRDPASVHKGLSPAMREIASEQLFFRVSDGLLNNKAYEEFLAFRAKEMADRLSAYLELDRR